jgi:molybdenum cofactor biosynthesis enzyme MoaA
MNNSKIHVEITHRCRLQCHKCLRNINPSILQGKSDISLEDFDKISKYFKKIIFCGSISDPIYHPQFQDILKICRENGNKIFIDTNGSGKSLSWWHETFSVVQEANWNFSLDGLPNTSFIYRVNQDGEQVFEAMKLGTQLGANITWKYIVFSYNENDIQSAHVLANNNGMKFKLVKSSRWLNNDPFTPKNKDLYVQL